MSENTTPSSPQISSMETEAYKEILIAQAFRKLKTVKVILFVIAAVQLILGLVYYFNGTFELDGALIQLIIALIFFGLALLVDKKPRVAVISGLVLYGLLIALNAVVEPESIVKGIILKVVIIYAFVKGIRAANEAEELRDKLGKIEMKEKDMPIDLVD